MSTRGTTPIAVKAAIIFSALFSGTCSALARTVKPIVAALRARDGLIITLLDYAPGVLLNGLALAALWFIWKGRRNAVWAYAGLSLLQLAVVGLSTGATVVAAVLFLALRSPPVVAAYFYPKHFFFLPR